MRRLIVGLLSLFFLFSCAGLVACNFGRDSGTGNAEQGEYIVRYYFEDDNGDFVHDPSKDETGMLDVGKTISGKKYCKTFEGYTFDEDNPKNKDFEIIRAEKTVVLEFYYKKTVGGETPSEPGTVVLNILNSKYVKAAEQETKATLSVSAPEDMQGLVALYNTAETINVYGAKESYYLFATEGGKASLKLFNGENFVEIKSADITAPSVGDHEYKMQIDAQGAIVCSLDNAQVLTVAESDFTAQGCTLLNVAGRSGTYNASGNVNSDGVEIISGDMTFAEIKAHFNTVLGRVSANYYVFNARSLAIENRKEEIPFSWIYDFGAQAEAFSNQVNACESLAELLAFAGNKQANDKVKVASLKQHVKASLGSFIQMYNDCLLMPMVSASQVEVIDTKTGASIGVVVSADVFARDTRWWVPNAYMLYSTWPEPHQMGVMDMLESEVNATSDYAALYNMSDKYIADIVRALSYKGLEFYYWHEYSKDPDSVLSEWWYLYKYQAANGEGFVYAGNVFPDYTWKKDYRLPKAFFDPTDEAFSNDPQAIMNNYMWLLTRQTLAAVDYTVTLNACGGTVDSTTLTGNSGADLALPTPTKTGATFGGWYHNPAYEGTGISAIAANTNRKDITLYAKWLEGDAVQALAVDPADVFGSNMIIQQNKPFNVFGTGVDGTAVTVSLDGATKTATVENGKWSVAFEAMQATWTAKTLTISGGGVHYSFGGILVGEVWLGAGQSNMQMSPSWMNGTGVNYVGQYGYYDNFSKIRIYRQQVPGQPYDGEPHLTNQWAVMENPNQALSQSAYALSFALNLQKNLNVPVGVITSCMGATYIEEWLSSSSLASTGSVIDGTEEENEESRYYYGMTELLRGVHISGVIWYQGENNAYAYNYPNKYPHASGVDYGAQLVALHGQYKDIFGDANLPLIVTELAPYAHDDYEDFRLVQRKFVSENANTYLLSTVDIGEAHDIHPVYKNELGRRAANIALEFVYKAQGVSDTLSYVPVSATQANGKITLSFEQGKTVTARGTLIGFKVENEQGVLEDVAATVSGNQVVINYSGNAVKVYYMYVKTTVGAFNPSLSYYIGAPMLYGGNGLPVAPFAIAVNA